MGTRIGFTFWFLADTIAQQAEKQGIVVENADAHEEHSKMILELRLAGLVTDSESDRAHKRLMKQSEYFFGENGDSNEK